MTEGLGKKKKSTKRLAPLESTLSPSNKAMSATSKSIESRRELELAVKKLNPASVTAAPQAFWDVEGSLKSTVIDSSNISQQLVIVENGVNYSAKRYNDLKVINDRLTFELKNKLDELDNEKKAFEHLDAMKNATTDDGIRLEKLDREIAAVEEEIYVKTHYSRQLEFMLERLKKNQLKFDAHMVGMEETFRSIEKEGAEVRLLRKGLDAGLAKAVLVLEETQNKLESSRKMREVLLAQRKNERKSAEKLQEWMARRQEVKTQLKLQLRGELSKQEEEFLKNELRDKVEKTKNLQKATESSQKRLQAMEDAFAKLKQVTGVSSIEEMHEKFSNQHLNKKTLEADVKEAEAKLLAAKKAHMKQEKLFEEVKASGSSIADFSRDSIKKLEDEILAKKNELKVCRAVTERITSILLGLSQGARGLQQRTQPYMYIAEGEDHFESAPADEGMPWAETLESLSSSEIILAKMAEHLNGDAQTGTTAGNTTEKTAISEGENNQDYGDSPPANANNIRIKSLKIIREMDEGFSGVEAMIKEDMEDNKNSHFAQNDIEDGVAAGSGVLNFVSGLAGGSNIEEGALSRLAVKKDSASAYESVKKKQDMDLRMKRLAETKGNGNDDLALAARLKAQKETGDRLCTVKHTPTLPQGVTLRDDVMSKAKAFLSQMPDLM